MDILKSNLIENYNKEILQNQDIQKIINSKAEDSLKSVTERLKEKLLRELDKYFPKEEEKKDAQSSDKIDCDLSI